MSRLIEIQGVGVDGLKYKESEKNHGVGVAAGVGCLKHWSWSQRFFP